MPLSYDKLLVTRPLYDCSEFGAFKSDPHGPHARRFQLAEACDAMKLSRTGTRQLFPVGLCISTVSAHPTRLCLLFHEWDEMHYNLQMLPMERAFGLPPPDLLEGRTLSRSSWLRTMIFLLKEVGHFCGWVFGGHTKGVVWSVYRCTTCHMVS